MILTLIRDTFTPSETLGSLYIDRKPFCDTIEPPSQNQQVVSGALKGNGRHQKGCIPIGWYKVQVTKSPKFGRLLPLLCYVPGFEGIRIHAGNNRDHTAGCILVGELSRREIEGYTVPILYNSRKTEEALTQEILKAQNEHEEIYIDITDSDRYHVERSVLDRL